MYDKPNQITALEAQFEALKIAFSPVVFQTVYALYKLGILELLSQHPESGLAAEAIAEQLELSTYGVKVLLDVGLSAKLVWQQDTCYILDKIGYLFLLDKMVQVNLNFMQDFCYHGLAHLLESIKTGKPEGLKQVFGQQWETLYPALSTLPEPAKSSWFAFDHYYSDKSFPDVLPVIFNKKNKIKTIFDIGGNTGKFTAACLDHDKQVEITIIDLPEQLALAQQTFNNHPQKHRINYTACNLLETNPHLPTGANIIWMSQFLDCFSETEILNILNNIVAVMEKDTRLYILELFWDRQQYEAAAYSINCTSIYFTCMANGNSRMYHSKDLIKLIHQAGLVIETDIDHLGGSHTLLGCKI